MGGNKTAVISDVHGNRQALEAVLADADAFGVGEILCLGDVVGYGGAPVECAARLRQSGAIMLRGNHEEYLSGPLPPDEELSPNAFASIHLMRRLIADDLCAELSSLPLMMTRAYALLTHATPAFERGWEYLAGDDPVAAAFDCLEHLVCFCGHTHVMGSYLLRDGDLTPPLIFFYDQLMIEQGWRHLINVGSVGQPRDDDPRAAYVIWDEEERRVTARRVPYDIEAAAQDILDAGLPGALCERLFQGK